MTRRFLSLFAGLLATGGLLRADTTNTALVKSAILENNVAYLRVGRVGKNLAEEIQSAQIILAAMNQTVGTVSDLHFADGDNFQATDAATNSSAHETKRVMNRVLTVTNTIIGTVLDLRFANGDDFEAVPAVAKLFAVIKSPLMVLVNGETRGAAAKLAADLRQERAGLVFGNAAADLKPDIAVTVSADDEGAFFKNPYAAAVPGTTNDNAATNGFSPFIDHTSEADLVRAKIKDGDQDEDSLPAHPTEPQKPFIHDPVLARAVDLIKALAVVRPSRS